MTYMNAEMELVTFAAEDVLATSTQEEETTVRTTRCYGEDTILPEEEL